jgi:hypothetical protein
MYSPIRADRWSCGRVLLYLLDSLRKEDGVLTTAGGRGTQCGERRARGAAGGGRSLQGPLVATQSDWMRGAVDILKHRLLPQHGLQQLGTISSATATSHLKECISVTADMAKFKSRGDRALQEFEEIGALLEDREGYWDTVRMNHQGYVPPSRRRKGAGGRANSQSWTQVEPPKG